MNYTDKQLEKMFRMSKYHIEHHPLLNLIKVVEELSEFNIELCKYLIIKLLSIVDEKTQTELVDYPKLFNEMFDADFMIYQAKMFFLIDNNVLSNFHRVVDAKLDRELKRWGLEK